METSAPNVAEIQGLYGAFSFPEKLLQKIWLRGDFARALARTTDGRALHVVHPGKWNLLGGPDFRGARVRFDDGRETVGDVELHLRAADWDAHGHARDRAYDGVILHVVLFPAGPGRVTRGAGGREIPVLVLLPLLHHDLEEYAAEEAIETLAGGAAARATEELARLPAAELLTTLRTHAAARWRQKVHFARLRVQRLGWAEACHHAALEILGYRFNRAPMLRVAGRWPLAAWGGGAALAQEAFAAEAGGWSVQGVRPANHPRTRLRQYSVWMDAQPDWPARLRALGADIPAATAEEETKAVRRRAGFAAWRERFAGEICGDAVGGTRLDNLVCDGFLPLLAADDDTIAGEGVWFHWAPGDMPPFILRVLRELGVFARGGAPAGHGFAQGVLNWALERERRA